MKNAQFDNMQKLAFGKVNESVDIKSRIKELVAKSLGEAKKKKEKPEDVIPQGEEEIEIEAADTIAPDHAVETDIDPKVKAVQDSLQKAFANAQALGDEKLMTQIGNSITYFTRTQVLGSHPLAEGKTVVPEEFKGIYDEGVEYCEAAGDKDENPYDKGTPQYKWWLKGYNDNSKSLGVWEDVNEISHEDSIDDFKISREQAAVQEYYLEMLHKFEETNTDDVADFKNLAAVARKWASELEAKAEELSKQ